MLICEYSKTTLEHYLGQSFGGDCDWEKTDKEGYEAWKKWLEENNNNLVWNNDKKVYETN